MIADNSAMTPDHTGMIADRSGTTLDESAMTPDGSGMTPEEDRVRCWLLLDGLNATSPPLTLPLSDVAILPAYLGGEG